MAWSGADDDLSSRSGNSEDDASDHERNSGAVQGQQRRGSSSGDRGVAARKRTAKDNNDTGDDEAALQKEYAQAAKKAKVKSISRWTTERLSAVDDWLTRIPTEFTERLRGVGDNLGGAGAGTTTAPTTAAAAAAAYSRTLVQCYMDTIRDVVGTTLHPLDALRQMQVLGSKPTVKNALINMRHALHRDVHLQQVLGAERTQRLLQQQFMETTTGSSAANVTESNNADASPPLDSVTTAGTPNLDDEEVEATFGDGLHDSQPPSLNETASANSDAAAAAAGAAPANNDVIRDEYAQLEREMSRQVAAELAERRRRLRRIVVEDDDDDEAEFDDSINDKSSINDHSLGKSNDSTDSTDDNDKVDLEDAIKDSNTKDHPSEPLDSRDSTDDDKVELDDGIQDTNDHPAEPLDSSDSKGDDDEVEFEDAIYDTNTNDHQSEPLNSMDSKDDDKVELEDATKDAKTNDHLEPPASSDSIAATSAAAAQVATW
jgi:hypothetical protein